MKTRGIRVVLMQTKLTDKTQPIMEQQNAPSTKGKGLGMAGMIIGIVALVWAIIPLLGAAAWWLATTGLILSAVAFFMAKGAGNTKRGGMIAGIVLNIIALGLAIFWIYSIAAAATEIMDNVSDTAALREMIENGMNN